MTTPEAGLTRRSLRLVEKLPYLDARLRQRFGPEFQKKIGYRFVLRRIEYPQSVKAGQMMPLSSWWLNAGVSPVYYEYNLAFQLYSEAGRAVLPTSVDVRQWLPGDAVFDGTIYVPDTLKSGRYRLRVGILDPVTRQPAIQLAIEGKQSDGWYDLGEIQIE